MNEMSVNRRKGGCAKRPFRMSVNLIQRQIMPANTRLTPVLSPICRPESICLQERSKSILGGIAGLLILVTRLFAVGLEARYVRS